MAGYQLTALIEREGDLFVARCVELDLAGKGSTGAAAFSNLKETVSTFLENANDTEIVERLASEVEVILFEVDRP